jgi:hypothetical protein
MWGIDITGNLYLGALGAFWIGMGISRFLAPWALKGQTPRQVLSALMRRRQVTTKSRTHTGPLTPAEISE